MGSSSEKGQFNRNHDFQLGIPGFCYSDLFDAKRLAELAEVFYSEVSAREPALGDALRKYITARGQGLEKRAASKVLTDAAPLLSDFIARMFGITSERTELEREIIRQDPIWKYKFFVQRRAVKVFTPEKLAGLNHAEVSLAVSQLRNKGYSDTLRWDDELGIAEMTSKLLDAEETLSKTGELSPAERETVADLQTAFDKLKNETFGKIFSQFAVEIEATGDLLQVKSALRILEAWSAAEFFKKEKRWKAFKTPHALDYQNLVHLIRPDPSNPNLMQGPADELRRRDGFKLTDDR